jgi:YesN/AraC family two-component response regulator
LTFPINIYETGNSHPHCRRSSADAAGLRQVIEIEPNLKIVGEAGNGSEALAMIEELKPDVAILDVDMPHQDGFQVARSCFARKIRRR